MNRLRAWFQNSKVWPFLAVTGLAVASIWGIQAFVVKPYEIPSDSMEPVLEVGQGILVNRPAYRFGDPEIGDIAVFHPPSGAVEEPRRCGAERPRGQACSAPVPGAAGASFVKRVAALPGDRVRIVDGIAVVNGERVDPSWVGECRNRLCRLPREFVVPPGHYFMLGDHRTVSDDSRVWGPVPRDSFVGKAFFVYSPASDFGRL